MNERIVYSKEQMMASLDDAMKELNTFRYDRRYREALGEALIKKVSAWEETILSQKNNPFTLVVIGDFKRGKSTLINALLGEEIVTSDVTTETVTLNQLDYGTHSNEAILSKNRRALLSDAELKREQLEKVISELNEPVEYLELKRPNELLKKIRIIDTPGTGDAMKDFSEIVQKSLLQADAVIYVYNIQYPLSKTEQLFLKSAVLPQKQTKLFLVGNYTDVLSSQAEFDHVNAFLKNKIDGFLPNSTVYMISALDELSRQLGEETLENEITPILRSQFQNLRDDLNELVEERADTILLSRMQRLTTAMALDISQNLDSLEKGLHLDDEELQKVLMETAENQKTLENQQDEVQQILKASIRAMKQETLAWMNEFMARISKECTTLGSTSAEDIKRYFEFYCVDLLQNAMNTCMEYHEDKLYEMLADISDEVSSKISDILPEQRGYQFRVNLDNRIWTKGDTVGLVTSQLANFGMLGTVASLVSDGITGMLREKESEERVPELMKQISQKILGLQTSISQTVAKQYGDLENNVEKVITSYFRNENENKKNLMEQTMQTAAMSAKEKENSQRIIEEARNIIKKIVEFNQA